MRVHDAANLGHMEKPEVTTIETAIWLNPILIRWHPRKAIMLPKEFRQHVTRHKPDQHDPEKRKVIGRRLKDHDIAAMDNTLFRVYEQGASLGIVGSRLSLRIVHNFMTFCQGINCSSEGESR